MLISYHSGSLFQGQEFVLLSGSTSTPQESASLCGNPIPRPLGSRLMGQDSIPTVIFMPNEDMTPPSFHIRGVSRYQSLSPGNPSSKGEAAAWPVQMARGRCLTLENLHSSVSLRLVICKMGPRVPASRLVRRKGENLKECLTCSRTWRISLLAHPASSVSLFSFHFDMDEAFFFFTEPQEEEIV